MIVKRICFSLWGDSALYCQGAIDNVAEAKKVYPDWVCRFYVASDCPALDILKTLDCEVIEMPPQKGIDRTDEKWTWQVEHCGMFWRYFILEEMGSDDVSLFRDCDSLVNKRDADAVERWLSTDYNGMRIHENKAHWNAWAMGGMWGWRGPELKGIKESIEMWIEMYPQYNHPYIFIDLEWINKILGPAIDKQTIGFGLFHPNSLPPLEDTGFVGEVYRPERREQKFDKELSKLLTLVNRNILMYDSEPVVGEFTKKLMNLALRRQETK